MFHFFFFYLYGIDTLQLGNLDGSFMETGKNIFATTYTWLGKILHTLQNTAVLLTALRFTMSQKSAWFPEVLCELF